MSEPQNLKPDTKASSRPTLGARQNTKVPRPMKRVRLNVQSRRRGSETDAGGEVDITIMKSRFPEADAAGKHRRGGAHMILKRDECVNIAIFIGSHKMHNRGRLKAREILGMDRP